MKSVRDRFIQRRLCHHPWTVTVYRRNSSDGVNSVSTEVTEEAAFTGHVVPISGRYIREVYGWDAVTTSTFYILFVDCEDDRDLIHTDYVIATDGWLAGKTMKFQVLQYVDYCQYLMKEIE